MAKRSGFSLSAELVLQICLGAFFLSLGIMGLSSHDSTWNQIRRAFGRNDTLLIITAIVELAMGGLLLLRLFFRIEGGLAQVLGIALVALWALYMVITYVVNDPFEPSFIPWLFAFSRDAVILVGLWIVGRRTIA